MSPFFAITNRQVRLHCSQMMRTLHSLLAAAAVALAGFVATAQAQDKPEEKPPADIWQAAEKGDIEAIKGFNNLVTVPPQSWTNSMFYDHEKMPQWSLDEAEAERVEQPPEVQF